MRNIFRKLIVNPIKSIIKETSNSISDFGYAPIHNLSVLFSSIGCIVALIGCIVSVISFASDGGYTLQLSNYKESGLDEAFTRGNGAALRGGIVGIIIAACFVLSIVFMAITYFKNVSGAKRVLMIIDFMLMLLFIGITALYNAIINNKIDLTDAQIKSLQQLFQTVNYQTILTILLCISLFTIVIFAILLFLSEKRGLLGHVFKSAVFSFLAISVFLLIVENLIALAIVALLWIVLNIVFKVLLQGEGSSGATGSSVSRSSANKPSSAPKSNVIENLPKGCIQKEVAVGNRLFVDKGYGPLNYNGVFVYVETALYKGKDSKIVCSYKDFQDGKVILTRNGKRITHIP